ncbi:MAG: ribonuclease E inhibitor RraB [Acidimicrobiia bacterium]|nr:ribonuclease E inhibitor RraB [Acidimicrobiia bacterium]
MEQTWMSYRSDERMIMVDARFEKWRPPGMDHVYIVKAPMTTPGPHGHGDEDEVTRFHPLEDTLNAEADELGLVSVGRRRGFNTWELAWYGPGGLERKFIRALKDNPEGHLSTEADPEWHHYRDKLLPRHKDLHRARNGLVVYQLLEAGDHLDQPREIDFYVYFHREFDRDRYQRDVGSIGLDTAAIEAEGKPGIKAYFTAAIDVELITDITWELHERAQLLNGDFDGWGCVPVTGT